MKKIKLLKEIKKIKKELLDKKLLIKKLRKEKELESSIIPTKKTFLEKIGFFTKQGGINV